MNGNPAIRLAVIDDHPVILTGLQSLLSKEDGIAIICTASSLLDFQKLGAQPLDLILLDLNIPGENHRENIQLLRNRYPQVKIVAYTSYNSPDLVRETLKLGCAGFLLKQISKTSILNGIHAILDGERHVCTEDDPTSRVERTFRRGNAAAAAALPDLKDDFQKRLLLSKREKEILNYISKGFTSQDIADELYISRYTVETHRKNILRKLNFNTSTELVKFAVQQGLV